MMTNPLTFRASLILGVFFLAPLAGKAAGAGASSHGGDAVVCYDREVNKDGTSSDPTRPLNIVSVELLDQWEWRQSSNRPIDLGSGNLSVGQKVRIGIDRLKALDVVSGLAVEAIFGKYAPAYVDRAKIPHLPDSTPRLERTKNCVVEQLAVQTQPTVFGQAWIQIDKKLFDRLSADGQAGLVLHELLYRFALDQTKPPVGSDGVRYLNFILNTDTRDIAADEYVQIVEASKLHFDHFGAYTFFHLRTRDVWPEIGLAPSDFVWPAEETLMRSLEPIEAGLMIKLTATRAFQTKPYRDRFKSTFSGMPGDEVYFDLRSGLPIALSSKGASKVEQEPNHLTFELLGNSKCFYQAFSPYNSNSLNLGEKLTCEPGGDAYATFIASIDGDSALPLSGFEDSPSKRVFVSHGKDIHLSRTFSWPRPTVKKSAVVSGSVRTSFIVPSFPNEEKRTRYEVQVECLPVNTTPCSYESSGARGSLKPGEMTTLRSKVRNPYVI